MKGLVEPNGSFEAPRVTQPARREDSDVLPVCWKVVAIYTESVDRYSSKQL